MRTALFAGDKASLQATPDQLKTRRAAGRAHDGVNQIAEVVG